MIKADIVKAVAREMNLNDRDALGIVDHVIESFKIVVQDSERLEIRDFGVFQIKQRKPRIGRNPRNKKEYPIAPHKVVTFKAGKNLKVRLPENSDEQIPLRKSAKYSRPTSKKILKPLADVIDLFGPEEPEPARRVRRSQPLDAADRHRENQSESHHSSDTSSHRKPRKKVDVEPAESASDNGEQLTMDAFFAVDPPASDKGRK